MTFPILLERDLPAPNSTCERPDIDFKLSAAPTASPIEMAKDVAALANTVGGSIIIGAATAGSLITSYPGIAASVAALLPNAFEKAAKERCRPSPRMASQQISRSGGDDPLVIINVWPSPIAPVGVHVRQKLGPETGAVLVDETWAFPIRVGSHTRYLQPDQFGSLESVSARRAAALLLAIPSSEREKVELRWTRPVAATSGLPYSKHQLMGSLEAVLPDQNVVHFLVSSRWPVHRASRHSLHVPLDWIETVWRDEQESQWAVYVAGVIEPEPSGTSNYKVDKPR
jgi:hypothetical protein